MSLSPPSDKHVFPPAELEDARKPEAAAHWESLQPPPNSALIALAHRMGIATIFGSSTPAKAKAKSTLDDEQMALLIRQACTHDSFARQHATVYPDESVPPTNGMLASLGNTLLGLFATEHLNASYPHLPTRVLKAATSAYVGHQTCVNVAQELGVAPLVRWHRQLSSASRQSVTYADALASVPRALTALIYHHRSLAVARKFAHTFFLSRLVDLRGLIKFRDPKLALSYTVESFGRERPISKLLRESGRGTNSPIYVVGIFSGVDKLGEGFGSSLKMAEFRAAEDALHRLYLTRVPSDMVSLPTTAFPTPAPKEKLSVFDAISKGAITQAPYEPFSFPTFGSSSQERMTTIGQSEILFGINDKKDVNVVEDLKRPWWRPAGDYPINSPQAERVREIKAQREADRKRAVAERESEGRPEAKEEVIERQGRMRTAEDMQA
ncbi:SubName: Full=Related to MRPL3-Mitochondrial ribosomal protein, large subunit {ECO:0000313/EMBL:CCA74656.1} [Serendipita indica DSM 11827]|nr:SubName: Full=Related to MRPL3-Mitochondrial ribosomal protein, large subunit {ECO:0000313/EMBL:CCA74656.1} [Serendipita indica DSM 11827]